MQSLTLSLDAGELELAEHGRHDADEFDPARAEYLPAVHGWQSDSAALPLVFEYFPAAQDVQPKAALVEYLPGAQWIHKLDELAPMAEYLPLTHEMQSICACVGEYLPATHGLQSEPLTILVP